MPIGPETLEAKELEQLEHFSSFLPSLSFKLLLTPCVPIIKGFPSLSPMTESLFTVHLESDGILLF